MDALLHAHAIGARYDELNDRAQALFEAWADLARVPDRPRPFVPLPMFPSFLADQHLALQEPRTAEQAVARAEADLPKAEAILGEMAIRALRDLGPEGAERLGQAKGLSGWRPTIAAERLAMERLPRDEYKRALPSIARDLLRALGPVSRQAPLRPLLARAGWAPDDSPSAVRPCRGTPSDLRLEGLSLYCRLPMTRDEIFQTLVEILSDSFELIRLRSGANPSSTRSLASTASTPSTSSCSCARDGRRPDLQVARAIRTVDELITFVEGELAAKAAGLPEPDTGYRACRVHRRRRRDCRSRLGARGDAAPAAHAPRRALVSADRDGLVAWPTWPRPRAPRRRRGGAGPRHRAVRAGRRRPDVHRAGTAPQRATCSGPAARDRGRPLPDRRRLECASATCGGAGALAGSTARCARRSRRGAGAITVAAAGAAAGAAGASTRLSATPKAVVCPVARSAGGRLGRGRRRTGPSTRRRPSARRPWRSPPHPRRGSPPWTAVVDAHAEDEQDGDGVDDGQGLAEERAQGEGARGRQDRPEHRRGAGAHAG